MSHREEIVAACRALLAAREREDVAVEAKDRALAAVHTEDGISQRQVSPTVQEWLEAAGFTAEEIAKVGVSTGQVIRAVDRYGN